MMLRIGRLNLSIVLLCVSMFLTQEHIHGNINFIQQNNSNDTLSNIESLIATSKALQEIDKHLSLKAISQAQQLAEYYSDLELKAKCNHLAGNSHSLIKDSEMSLINLKQALAYYEKTGNKTKSTPVLADIGLAYQNNNKHSKALVYLNSALADYIILNDSLGITTTLYNIGNSNYFLGNNIDALNNYSRALSIAMNNNFNKQIVIIHISLSNFLIEYNNTHEIPENLDKALAISKILNDKKLEAEVHLVLARYYKSSNDSFAAAIEMKTFIALKNSYTLDKNENLEKLLLKISEFNKVEKRENIGNMVFILLAFLLLIIVVYLIFKLRKQNSLHKIKIDRCNSEIIAFNTSTSKLDEKIEEKSEERINELDDEIIRNKKNKVSLSNSQNNLNQVNHLKDMFLSKISHEIRTPLSGILGFAEILENQLALDEETDLFEYAKSITDSGMSLVSLLNNILDISRLNSDNLKLNISDQNPVELIQSVIDNYFPEANLKGIKLIYDAKHLPDIQTDNQIFTKILSLVLSNSVKFTEKGFIKVSNQYDEESKQITIVIKDTGIGIDKVYMEQVFEPYRQESLGYSTSYQGAGLGLPLAKKMTTKLDGTITLESAKGKGTSVTIVFPMKQVLYDFTEIQPIETVEKPIVKVPKKNKLPWETLSILVVEDDNMNQLLYRKMLKSAKNLEIAKDGKVAMATIEKHLSDNKFDVVLMDINLPNPWNGITLMKEIRSKWPAYKDIPFIAQTAYAISGNRESMLDEGFDEYLTKPIIKSTLVKTVVAVINNSKIP